MEHGNRIHMPLPTAWPFVLALGVALLVTGMVTSAGVSLLGLPHVFFAPALYGLIATVGIAVMSRSRFAVR